jgi:predicted AlkP superfamily pyrophosphatase or phosphodiesterase
LQTFNADLRDRFRQESWVWKPLHAGSGTSRIASYTFSNGATLANGQFPRVIQAVGLPVDACLTPRLRASPFYDEITLDGAKALIEGEGLGEGKSTDLLAISLSATDYVGHAFGAGSAEMEDNLLRLDERLGAFLNWLQARVPELCVVLTADHGGLDLLESLQAGGFNAKRLDPKAWMKALNDKVRDELRLSQAPILPESEPHQLFLNPRAMEGTASTKEQIIQALVSSLEAMAEVQEVATSKQLAGFQETDLGSPRDNAMLARLKHSFDPARSGDILVAFKPLVALANPRPFGVAGHGSPHDYDRRVPLLFWGPWKAAERKEPVRTIDLAPTLARALGPRPSAGVDGKALELPLTTSSSDARSPR